jgi:hypothetical protein
MGNDLVDNTAKEFRKGFNKIFYGVDNYTYNYQIKELENIQKLDFLKDSLYSFDSLNNLLNNFLRYNFVSLNNYIYTIDNSFRFGFFVKRENSLYNTKTSYVNWMSSIPKEEIASDSLNSFQKIKNYEKLSSDEDITNKLKTDWVKRNMLYNDNSNSSLIDETPSVKKKNPTLKSINNKEIIDQAFSMIMDKRYNVTKVISSFSNTGVTQLILDDTKEKNTFSGEKDRFRYINSNQNIDVMIKAYLRGFNKKVGG